MAQPADIDALFNYMHPGSFNFSGMALEKKCEKEKDLEHCPVYVKELFQEHPELLKEPDYNAPCKHGGGGFSLDIDLRKRIYNKPHPLTHYRQEIKEEVLSMERKGIIQRGLSIHNSPIVAARKRSGKIRICNDC